MRLGVTNLQRFARTAAPSQGGGEQFRRSPDRLRPRRLLIAGTAIPPPGASTGSLRASLPAFAPRPVSVSMHVRARPMQPKQPTIRRPRPAALPGGSEARRAAAIDHAACEQLGSMNPNCSRHALRRLNRRRAAVTDAAARTGDTTNTASGSSTSGTAYAAPNNDATIPNHAQGVDAHTVQPSTVTQEPRTTGSGQRCPCALCRSEASAIGPGLIVNALLIYTLDCGAVGAGTRVRLRRGTTASAYGVCVTSQ